MLVKESLQFSCAGAVLSVVRACGEGGREGGGEGWWVYSRVEQPPSEAWQCQYRRQFPVSVALGFLEFCSPVTSPASVTVSYLLFVLRIILLK